MIRFFDIIFSLLGLIILMPLYLLIILLIRIDSGGGAFFMQLRVGKNNRDFKLIKFRTMSKGAEKKGKLTIGARDARITKPGYFLRKYKLDELPQLINVLKGDMSMVGPRPEVRKYVDCYSAGQKVVLTVKPGITDYASIQYIDENEILGKAADPEMIYINVVMPAKIELNKKFIENRGLKEYFTILFKTISKIAGN